MTQNQLKILNQTLPAVAVQALYHAVTGKTENLSKLLRKRYIVRLNDIKQLHAKLCQQIEHYNVIGGPTTTINLTFENFEHQRFSSWDRFKIFDIGKSEIVKNLAIKIEFIIQIQEITCAPNINTAQRYIIDVDIDSELRSDSEPDVVRERALGAFVHDFPPCSISIDYVDYVIAKNILNTVEEWFKALEEAKNPRWVLHLARYIANRPVMFVQVGYIGAAIFLAFYALWGSRRASDTMPYYTASLAIFFFVGTSIISREIFENFTKRIIKSIIPSSIILTAGDERAYETHKERVKTIVPTFLQFLSGIIASLTLNIVASYAYTYLTR